VVLALMTVRLCKAEAEPGDFIAREASTVHR
jgi:hypothetical protein